jgi:hypothetical protein
LARSILVAVFAVMGVWRTLLLPAALAILVAAPSVRGAAGSDACPDLFVIKKVIKHDKGWRLTTDPAAAGAAPPLTLVDRLGDALRSGAREFWQELSAAL